MPKHSGGGEKYLLDCMRVLLKRGQDEVYLALSSSEFLGADATALLIKRYEKFFGYDLSGLKIIATPLGTKASFSQKLWWTKKFDVLYYATDGSLFFSLAKKNILHIQVPLKLNKRSLMERLKLKNWQVKNTNSFFTKNYVEKTWPVKIDQVHQPLVDLKEFPLLPVNQLKKTKMILHVGRFFRQLHSKRQDVLVKIFRQLLTNYPEKMKGWRLVLVGSKEDPSYAAEVAELAKGLPIKIHHDLDRQALLKLYQQASIYWHATGYGLDETELPSAMEHFGIAPIEAMAAYCVPLLIAKGGHKEILGETLQDCLWTDDQDCINQTINCVAEKEQTIKLAQAARSRAQYFALPRFAKILLEMID